jgi:hypothetical protein
VSRGKHLSFEEARKAGKLDRYAKENPAIGDRDKFDRLLKAMAEGKKPSKAGTSTRGASANSTGTRSRGDK